MTPLFRRMILADVPYVHKIECELFTDPWPKESFIHDIQDIEISYPYVAEKEKKIIGYIMCWYYANEIHIGNIAVTPPHQNRGVGHYLLDKIFKLLKNYKLSFLEVRALNFKAINLYKKFGFYQINVRYNYYSNGEDALVMVKYPDR
jgi:ribosomal-protein-alanine N-acetyltransferase